MDIVALLAEAVEKKASDVFIVAGRPLTCKIKGNMIALTDERLDPVAIEQIVCEIYMLAGNRSTESLYQSGDDDFSLALPQISRFRVSAYKQRGSFAVVIRIVTFNLPSPEKLGITEAVLSIADRTKGMVLVTGAAGSGKSTTLACMIDRINQTRAGHIITLEDPVEFLHRHNKSIVSQREVSSDTESYVKALRAALRQSPDVILLGEMRDYNTINVAMTAAETGHLLFSTLHTVGAAKTIDRIVDAFQPGQQQQIRVQLAMVLQAVVSQQLLPTVDGRIVPAFEIMIANTAIRNLIRESKVHQIDTIIQSSGDEGMITMDSSLMALYEQGIITESVALTHSPNPEAMIKRLAKRK